MNPEDAKHKINAQDHADVDATRYLDKHWVPYETNAQGQIIRLRTVDTEVSSDEVLSKIEPLRHVKHFTIEGTRTTDRGLQNIRDWKSLNGLCLYLEDSETITGRGIEELFRENSFPHLVSFCTDVKVETDLAMKAISKVKSVKTIYLREANVTDAGIAELVKLEGLEELDVFSTKITNVSLKHIAQLKNLRFLDLSYTAVDDEGIQHLSALSGLESLGLAGEHLTDKTLRLVAEHSKLESLWVTESSHFTDAGVGHLVKLQNLRDLTLGGSSISDSCIEHLIQFKKLQYLTLEDTQITPLGMLRLEGELPHCTVKRM